MTNPLCYGYDGFTPDEGPEFIPQEKCAECAQYFPEEEMTRTRFGWLCKNDLSGINPDLSECCRAPFIENTTRCSVCGGLSGPYMLNQQK